MYIYMYIYMRLYIFMGLKLSYDKYIQMKKKYKDIKWVLFYILILVYNFLKMAQLNHIDIVT
jgi:hypothetical protein